MQPLKTHINIAIADDHPMVVKGIESMLRDYDMISIEQIYNNGEELMNGIKMRQPDVLLLDLHMPKLHGSEVLPQIVENYPAISVLIVTNEGRMENVQKMMEKGALGYVLKTTDQQTLIEAIVTVHNGKQYLDKFLKEPLMEYILNEKKRAERSPSLSRREKEMLHLIVDGYTNQEIAKALFLGQRTVETYRYNLMAKLEVKNVADLVRKTIEEQLLR